jgi:hypothetical protein
MSHPSVLLTHCPNCGRDLEGRFCAGCGQKVTALNPTAHDFLHDLTHELLHVDGKIFQSVRLLLTRPGFLTSEYFKGRRARYVSPIRLYLIFSVVYFAIAAAAPSSDKYGVQVKTTGNPEEAVRAIGFESEEQLEAAVNAAISTWAPRIMFVLVPLFALLVNVVTRRSGRNYPQHLYFAFHVHAAAFALLALRAAMRLARPTGWLVEIFQFVVMAWVVVYTGLAFRRAYDGTAARAVLRTAVVGLLYLFALGLALAAIIAPLIQRAPAS